MTERLPPTRAQLDAYAAGFTGAEWCRHFGAIVSFPDEQTVHLHVPTLPRWMRGGLGTEAVNGGVLAALFDLAIGATPALVDPTRRTATCQLSMDFMRPVKGDSFLVRARVKRAGGVLIYADAELVDETGQTCATCSGLVRISQQTWADGVSPAPPA